VIRDKSVQYLRQAEAVINKLHRAFLMNPITSRMLWTDERLDVGHAKQGRSDVTKDHQRVEIVEKRLSVWWLRHQTAVAIKTTGATYDI
jgi:hypothetical protein